MVVTYRLWYGHVCVDQAARDHILTGTGVATAHWETCAQERVVAYCTVLFY